MSKEAPHNMWLTDFLPMSFNNVRIMTYGYNTQLVDNPLDMTIFRHAKHLLEMLENARCSSQVRAF